MKMSCHVLAGETIVVREIAKVNLELTPARKVTSV